MTSFGFTVRCEDNYRRGCGYTQWFATRAAAEQDAKTMGECATYWYEKGMINPRVRVVVIDEQTKERVVVHHIGEPLPDMEVIKERFIISQNLQGLHWEVVDRGDCTGYAATVALFGSKEEAQARLDDLVASKMSVPSEGIKWADYWKTPADYREVVNGVPHIRRLNRENGTTSLVAVAIINL